MSLLPAGTIAFAAILTMTVPRLFRGMVDRRDRALAARAHAEDLEAQVEAMEARLGALEERLDSSEQLSARLARQLEARTPEPPPSGGSGYP